ncbi:hypothetical protein SAMN04487833_11249 [Sarcina sp. DSM 11001]|uniref:endo alpha-1,4 polygalactosaminidase n=1 Tax=Sarcina sp. DSM 11001 TaxID=1798184 RepID=UPI000889208A|nr:endo alpha-1,4 polygalactosaminidase [Sarcina sp. DSM 11001]SDL09199.1 hypothetical protein SAMN04487833_11249 [Sarcina sp. DSM 11001]
MSKTNKTTRTTTMKKRFLSLLLSAAICLTVIMPVTSVPADAASTTTWGVFIGVNLHGNTSRVKNYKSIVIDAEKYTAAEIKKLKSGGRKVYTYLSIGSIATYRSYYNRFKKYTIGGYTNWKNERWIDTSKKEWQDFVVNSLVANFKKKGVDGLWVDNTDVFYVYPRAGIFNGLVYTLRRCKNKGLPVIINGGDVFVTHCIKNGKKGCFDGVMQEEVLTRITNYNGNKFAIQLASDRKYYEAYLKRVKAAGYSIALLEYARGTAMRQTIARYCKNHGYSYYIATNVALN